MQVSPSTATLTLMLVTILMSPWHLAAECQHGLYYFRVLFSSFSVIQILVIACPATSPHEKKTVTVTAARCLIVVILLPVSSANSLYGFGKCYGLPMKYNQLESLMDTRSVSIPPGLLLLPQALSPFLSFPLLSAGHLLLHALENLHARVLHYVCQEGTLKSTNFSIQIHLPATLISNLVPCVFLQLLSGTVWLALTGTLVRISFCLLFSLSTSSAGCATAQLWLLDTVRREPGV